MSKGSSLLGGSAWLIAANCLENLGLLLFNLALIKVYGPGGHGRFVFYLSIISLLRLFLDAGIGSMLTKLLGQAERPPAEALGMAAGLSAMLNLPMAAVLVLVPGFFTGEASRAFSWFALWLLAMLIQNLAVSAFNGLQSMRSSFLITLIFEGAKLSLLVHLIFNRPAIEEFLPRTNQVMFLAALAASLYFLWKWRRRGISFPGFPAVSAVASQAVILWAPAAAIAAFPQASAVLLGTALTHRDVSFWTTILSWSMIGTVILTPAATALFAWNAGPGRAGRVDPAQLREYHRLIIVVAMGSALALLAGGDIILGMYGPEFLAHKTAFCLLVLAQLADHPRFLTVPLLAAGTRAKASLVLETARVASALGACAVAIAFGLGLMQIAGAVLAVYLAFGLIRIIYVRRILDFDLLRPYFRSLAACACCAPLLAWEVHPLLKVAGSAVCFLAFSGLRVGDLKSFLGALAKA